jgi:hypothetical protein
MLFGTSNRVLLFGRGVLQYFDAKKGEVAQCAFAPEEYFAQEVIDEKKFTEKLQEYLKVAAFKGVPVSIVLGKDMYFHALIPPDTSKPPNPNAVQEKITSFLETIPLEANNRLVLQVKRKVGTDVFVANKKLISTVTSQLETQTQDITLVVPAGPFAAEGTGISDLQKIIQKQQSLTDRYNFLSRDTESSSQENDTTPDPIDPEEEGAPPVSGKQIAVLVTGVVFIVLLATYGIVSSGIVTVPYLTPIIVGTTPTPKPTASIVPTKAPMPLPTVPVTAKKDLTLRVLNGSGIVGQAGKIKAALEENDFSNISTDSTENTTGTTQVRYRPGVAKSDSVQIEKLLTSFVASIEAQVVATGEADVVIVTAP